VALLADLEFGREAAMDLDYLVLSVKGPARAATGPSFRRRGFGARRGFNAPGEVESPEGQILG
jgi:hypothetical protein